MELLEREEKKKKPTVCIRVDSAFATSTKTSASRQCSSIHSSRSGETSIPGLQTTRKQSAKI